MEEEEPSVLAATANSRQQAQTAFHVVADGPATGMRVLTVSPAGGIHARVLLDRGLDIGSAWFQGEPIAWLSAAGERTPGHVNDADGWHEGWAGGLITTCGLRNVGAPSEGHGRHGSFTDCRAEDVTVSRSCCDDRSGRIVVAATLHDNNGLDRGLVLRRTLTFHLQRGVLELEDILHNESNEEEQTPILYHINFGYPFLDDQSTVEIETNSTEATAGECSPMGPPRQVPDEVLELFPAIDDGYSTATLHSRRLHMLARISWDSTTLPRLYSWQRRMPGSYVQAIEPANCSVLGRRHDRDQGGHPTLRPGQMRTTRMRLEIRADHTNRGRT